MSLESSAQHLGLLPTADRWRVSQVMNELAPRRWQRVRLGSLATVENGFPFESKSFNSTEGTPLIRIRDVGADDTQTFYRGRFDDRYLVARDDILVGMDGEFRCRRWRGRPGLLNQRVCRVRFTSPALDPAFGFMFLQPYLSAVQNATSSITVAHLSSKTVEDLELLVPPLNEQRRIVAKLDALQARSRRAREALEAVPPLLEKLRQSILAAAFRGDLTKDWRAKNPNVEPASALLARIRTERRAKWEESELAKMKAKGKAPTDDRWRAKYKDPEPVDTTGLAELPEGWCWASVGEVFFDSKIGLVRSASDQGSTGTPYVRMQHFDAQGRWNLENVSSVRVSDDELSEYALVSGDLLFNTRNSPELVGKVALWSREATEPHVFNNNLMRLRTETVLPEWAAWQMVSPVFRNRIVDFVSATTSVAAIYGRDLFRQPLCIPPVAEQRVAGARLEVSLVQVQARSRAVRAKLERLSALERAVLSKAFRGELVPQDWNDEAAEAMLARALER